MRETSAKRLQLLTKKCQRRLRQRKVRFLGAFSCWVIARFKRQSLTLSAGTSAVTKKRITVSARLFRLRDFSIRIRAFRESVTRLIMKATLATLMSTQFKRFTEILRRMKNPKLLITLRLLSLQSHHLLRHLQREACNRSAIGFDSLQFSTSMDSLRRRWNLSQSSRLTLQISTKRFLLTDRDVFQDSLFDVQ